MMLGIHKTRYCVSALHLYDVNKHLGMAGSTDYDYVPHR